MRRRVRRTGLAALIAASLLGASDVAAQSLTLPGTQPGTLAVGLAAAGQCSECHGGSTTSDGRAYMPADTWPTSMMANAVRDPLFLATLTDAEQDHPGLGTYCLRCHTPGGFTAGHASPGNGSALDPFNDTDGVHCDTCHRAVDMHTTPVGNAQIFFDDGSDTMAPTRHGPRDDPFASPRHPSIGDPYVRDARLCGQCHDVENPVEHRLDLDGHDSGANYPLQSTYSEWQQSRYAVAGDPLAQTCQGCHMPVEHGPLAVANIPGAPTRTDTLRHDFFGANEWGMALLKAAMPGAMDDAFDASRASIRTFLQTAATVEVLGAPTRVTAGGALHFSVRVTNRTGHKLPTGYEDSRLMWLQVQLGDTVVSGSDAEQVDASTGDAQLRAYRFVPGHIDATTHRPVRDDFIAQHTLVLEDTRIPPAGMMPDARTQPVGRDYTGGTGGALRNDDTTDYAFTVPATRGPVALTVRLMYRTTTQHYVDTIAAANHTDTHGTALQTAWAASGRAPPFAIATTTVMLDVDGATTDAGADATRDGGTMHEAGGCGCRTAPRPARGAIALTGMAFAWLVARRRRR